MTWNILVCKNVVAEFHQLLLDRLVHSGALFLSGGSGTQLFANLDPQGSLARTIRKITVGQVDERLVSPDSNDSNFHVLDQVMLQPLARAGVRPREVLRVLPDNLSSSMASKKYDQTTLEASGKYTFSSSEWETADSLSRQYEAKVRDNIVGATIHLGLGADGHTASLFPKSPGLDCTTTLVTSNFDPSGRNSYLRVSLTFRALAEANSLIFCVTGSEKAGIVRRLLEGENMPAQRLTSMDPFLLLDRDAASSI